MPEKVITNDYFLEHEFYDGEGVKIKTPNEEVISKFKSITGIDERRYVTEDQTASDLAIEASKKAIADANIDPETLDYIICSHNFGDVKNGKIDILPSLAARVKHSLRISNPDTVAYDTVFGCPGWVQAMIQADYYIKSGDAKRILVIGAETLSKVASTNDRDTMIYSDGAGAAILEAKESETPVGILKHKTRTDTLEYAYMLWMDKSKNPSEKEDNKYITMNGRKLYEYALNTVPSVVQTVIDKSELGLGDVKKVLIHQANEKMDEAILKRIFRLYKEKNIPEDVMPMTIRLLGNNSVATVPVLYDKIMKNEMEGHELKSDDVAIFASVGAGMSISVFSYKMP